MDKWIAPAILLAILLALFYRPRWRGSTTAHGTARFATDVDLSGIGMFSRRGLILGRTLGGRLIRFPRTTVHIAVFAPTGAGKGVSLIVPWLLTYSDGSCVVLDPKGENFRLASARRTSMGQTVIRLDPFHVCGAGADSFNPLALISDGPDCVDDCRSLAEMIVVRNPEGERDPHWCDMAAHCLTAFLVLIMKRLPPAERTLSALRELIADPQACESGAALLRQMGGIYANLGSVLGGMEAKEKSGVISTIHRHTTWLDSQAIGTGTATSSFNVRDLLTGKMTIYLILPPHQAEAQARWLRTTIGVILRLIGREGMRPGKECLCVLDEAGQLGHMEPLSQGLTLLRGAGLRMAFFFQSLTQLKEVFREREGVLLDNTSQVYFGTQSIETAERITKMIGDATITVESANQSYGDSLQPGGGLEKGSGRQTSRNYGRNYSVQARALLQPAEVMNLSGEYLLAFVRGVPPIMAKRVLWYRDSAFSAFLTIRSLLWWITLVAVLSLLAWGLKLL